MTIATETGMAAGPLSLPLELAPEQAELRDRARIFIDEVVIPLEEKAERNHVPALVVGLGGIWTEALDDVAVVPLPADPGRVEGAIRSLRGAPILTGGRGGERLDIAAAAAAAARVGELLLEHGLGLLELNPVVVHPRGCVALDAVGWRR